MNRIENIVTDHCEIRASTNFDNVWMYVLIDDYVCYFNRAYICRGVKFIKLDHEDFLDDESFEDYYDRHEDEETVISIIPKFSHCVVSLFLIDGLTDEDLNNFSFMITHFSTELRTIINNHNVNKNNKNNKNKKINKKKMKS